MAKKRSILVLSVFLILFLVLFVSSSFFKLCAVEIEFFDSNNKKIDVNSNSFYTTSTQVEPLKKLAKQDYGVSLFLIDTDKYFYKFESQNPRAKLLEVKSKLPNKLIFCVSERIPCYFISSDESYFILDSEYKILSVQKEAPQNLIEIKTYYEKGQAVNFFNFFNISSNAFVEGQFLSENNLLLTAIKNLKEIFGSSYINFDFVNSISFVEESEYVNLLIETDGEYGASIKIENILSNFDRKLLVVLQEFEKTIIENEQLKICFGKFVVGDSLKPAWNNL